MKGIQKIVSLATALLVASSSFAYRYYGSSSGNAPGMTTQNNQSTPATEVRAASCAPATALLDLEWNNVQARIETGGNMWQNRADGVAAYEVPKVDGTGVSSIFAGSLWMGGKSLDQTLKLAAVTFRTNNDFWTGPLTNDGTAEITSETCEEYDRFSVSLREDAIRHRTYWDFVTSGATAEQIAEVFPDGYSMPTYFNDFPAHGNTGAGQDFYLGPFKDYNSNGIYDPEYGDYPWYDFLREIDCAQRRREDKIPLFGDQTYFWIFNDKGNIHSESQGLPIGMEIRAQAFAFTTNDEVNNMTFLNYVLINQGSQTLTETYFGSWVDPDLGNSIDDYVGCDVQRGLGYCYNGDAFDEAGQGTVGYGENPPAVGLDFFEGPYQDEDTLANPQTPNILHAEDSLGIPYGGLGIGYNDTIIDNERFGMRRFVYYNRNDNPINGEPSSPQHYYNFLRGIWKNGQEMLFGGNGVSGSGVVTGMPAQYMFPGDTDPYNWSTYGATPPQSSYPWTEENAGNQPFDRRFIQSAGPFTLQPGDYNNITLGVVWARAFDGDPLASVELLRLADDKAQSLFDNCFELVNGPDAPDVAVQELDREIILLLSNNNPGSNNYQGNYLEFDPSIPDSLPDGTSFTQEERSYRFEGYLVYQLLNDEVSNADLNDVNKARLIAQCDLQNDVDRIINYSRDQTTGLITPQLMIDGENQGVRHSFRVIEDAFALGSSALVNHRTYYFMVIAYGYNNYAEYELATSTGQDDVFKPSRKSAVGGVQRIAAIPHNVTPESGGTVLNSTYGDGIAITRHEGMGNAKNNLILSASSEAAIIQPPYSTGNLEYVPGGGPVEIKVVDPVRVSPADFELYLHDPDNEYDPDSMHWVLENLTTGEVDSSFHSFATLSEDVVLDYGISISWGQYKYFNEDRVAVAHFTDFVDGSLEFADPQSPWLFGIGDFDGFNPFNWIRSGSVESSADTPEEEAVYDDYMNGSGDYPFTDIGEEYEKVIDGTWSPYCLVSYSTTLEDGSWINSVAPTTSALKGDLSNTIDADYLGNIKGLNNVDVVFTSDKSKWTRCVVLEMQPNDDLMEDQFDDEFGAPEKMKPRRHKSVDKNGRTSDDGGYNAAEGDLVSNWGMGWFPGYVIDVGTGERLNLAFGEDSWLHGANGDDMIWNPTAETGGFQNAVFGGQHWIYVFRNLREETFEELSEGFEEDYCPKYDEGQFLFSKLSDESVTSGTVKKIFRGCSWVGSALTFGLLTPEEGLIPNDARVRLRVAKPYAKYNNQGKALDEIGASRNDWRCLYSFSTKNVSAVTLNADALESALDMINIVPNPYYAFSNYETNKLDNRVKITNLPFVCTVSIYDLNGTLIRQFKKGDPTTYLDWDLKNHKNVPIASGTYIIHVNVPDVGEKILKWFGVMRPIDLDSF